MKLRKLTILVAVCAALLATPCVLAQGRPGAERRTPDQAEKPTEEEFRELLKDAGIEKLEGGRYKIGKVTLDAKKRTVSFPATIKVDTADQIELVVCVPEGKTYETIAVTEAEALHIQLALLLLNMDPGKNPAIDYDRQDPMARRPDGHLVHVLLEWQPEAPEGAPEGEKADVRRERIEWFLKDVETGKPLPPAEFAFIGSLWLKGGFAADLDGTLIALYEDPGTILELALPRAHSVPWSAAIEDRLPPTGTEIDIVIADIPEEEDGGGEPADTEPDETNPTAEEN